MFRYCIVAMMLSASASFAQEVPALSGTWGFTHWDDRFGGRIVIHQTGPTFRGTWHTSRGKSEPDDEVTGRIDGNTVTLWRFIGNNKQSFILTLSADRTRLDGFGDGFFLHQFEHAASCRTSRIADCDVLIAEVTGRTLKGSNGFTVVSLFLTLDPNHSLLGAAIFS